MKQKVLSSLLILSLFLGLLVLPIQASTLPNGASPYDPYGAQDLTGAKFPNMNLITWHEDLVFYNVNGKCGAMDVYGNSVLPPVYDLVGDLRQGYFNIVRNDRCALFFKNRQLTDFRYTLLEDMLLCIRASLPGGGYAFLDWNGKEISVPAVGNSEWSVIDIIPYKAILLYKPAEYRYDKDIYDGIIHTNPEYQVLDWKGKAISEVTDRNIKFADADSYIISGTNTYKHLRLDGSAVPVCPKGYYHMGAPDIPNCQYHILCKDNAYYLFDTNYNLIRKLETYENSVEPVVKLSATHILVRETADRSVIIDAKGTVHSQLAGGFATFIGIESQYSTTAPTDRFVTADGTNCYLYDISGKQLAVLENVAWVKNGVNYIIASLGDNRFALYDAEGNFLFEYSSNSNVICTNGILFREYGNKCAVLDRDGTDLTEPIFYLHYNATNFGLMCVRITGRNGYYLVNSKGEVLNSEGYDESPRMISSYCFYKQGGKSGFLRILRPGDPLFVDVPYGTWYYQSVEDCAALELFNGTSPAKFSPNKTMTRAMLVTVLWRLAGEPAPTQTADYVDVPGGSWYADAVAWASENSIVNGVGNGRFNPNGNVTREQIATIFRRYGESIGLDTEKQADLSSFPDAAQISSYATDAMAWANAMGYINGNRLDGITYLQPTGHATRAQVATILMRLYDDIRG